MTARTSSLLAITAIAALTLTGCGQADPAGDGDGDGSEPAFAMQETPTLPDDPPGAVRLRSDGLDVTGAQGTTLSFDSPRETVEKELARVLGPIADRGRNEECGAGPVDSTRYPGGLTLNFQQGRLVGWFLTRDAETGKASGDIATDAGVRLGSAAAVLEAAYVIDPIEASTLGDEFTSQQGVSGFLTGDGGAKSVESLYAGTTCFFR